MRVSAGLAVTGLSGKILIQILPPRLTWWVIARRAASICRAVTQVGSSAISPKSPKATVLPRCAMPRVRPRCCLRYLTRLGINISSLLLAARARAAATTGATPTTAAATAATAAIATAATATATVAALTRPALLLGGLGALRGRLDHLQLAHRVGEHFALVDPDLHA